MSGHLDSQAGRLVPVPPTMFRLARCTGEQTVERETVQRGQAGTSLHAFDNLQAHVPELTGVYVWIVLFGLPDQ